MEIDSHPLPWYRARFRSFELWLFVSFSYLLLDIFSIFDSFRYARSSDTTFDIALNTTLHLTFLILVFVIPVALAVQIAILRKTFSLWLIFSSGIIALITMFSLGYFGFMLLPSSTGDGLIGFQIVLMIGSVFVFCAGAIVSGFTIRMPFLARIFALAILIALALLAIFSGIKELSN